MGKRLFLFIICSLLGLVNAPEILTASEPAPVTGLSNAGCITYVELTSTSFNNIDAIEKIVDYAMEHDIPYFAINFPLDTCLDCNERIYEQLDVCPKCGSNNIQRLARITGYLAQTVEHFNTGKKQEYFDRVRHIKN